MSGTEEAHREQVTSAREDEIDRFLHDPAPKVIRALLTNRNLTEEHVLIIASRKNVPSDILETIAKDPRWAESYPVRLALARNPKSPLSVSLTMARYLRLFDLEEITRNQLIPLVFRHKVEWIIIEKIPTMPLGNKKTLAKKSAGNVLLKLLQDSDPEVIQLCLNNPRLVEAHLFKVISRTDATAATIRMIAEHPNWSNRSLIRFSLVRNPLTPLTLSVRFLQGMKSTDLRELYADNSVPVTIKPFLHRELWERGEGTEAPGEDLVYEFDDDEITAILAEENPREQSEEQQESKDKDSGTV